MLATLGLGVPHSLTLAGAETRSLGSPVCLVTV